MSQIHGGSNALFTRQSQNQMAKQTNFFVEKAFGKNGEWLLSAGNSGSFSTRLSN